MWLFETWNKGNISDFEFLLFYLFFNLYEQIKQRDGGARWVDGKGLLSIDK